VTDPDLLRALRPVLETLELLDDAYMRRWAPSLGVGDLLDRALAEAARRP